MPEAKKTVQDIAREMSADYAEGWKPQPQSVIMGDVKSLDRAYSEYQPNGYPVITITKEDGSETAVHCFHSALRAKVTELKPTLGEFIQIMYKGEQTTKDGKRTYQAYVVKMPNRTGGNFWGDEQASLPISKIDVTEAVEDDFPF